MIIQGFLLILVSAELKHLDDQSLKQILKQNSGSTLVLYYNSIYDQHYQNFLEVSQQVSSLNFTAISCANFPIECEYKKIPHIQYLQNTEIKPYLYNHTVENLLWLAKRISEPVKQIRTPQELNEFKRNPYSFILFSDSTNSEATKSISKIFQEIAENYKSTPILFGEAKGQSLWRSEQIDVNEIPIVLKYGKDQLYRFNISKFDKKGLEEFVSSNLMSVSFKMGPSEFDFMEAYCKDKVFLVSVVDGKNETEVYEYVDELKEVNLEYRKREDFKHYTAYVDINENPETAIDLEAFDHPKMVFWRCKDKTKKLLWLHELNPAKKWDFIKNVERIMNGKFTKEEGSHYIEPELRYYFEEVAFMGMCTVLLATLPLILV